MAQPPHLEFVEIHAACEHDAESAALFLSRSTWPFHACSTLTIEQAREIKLSSPKETRAFWINEHETHAGLVRVFDLQDAEHGSVLFDLRIAEAFRGRGIGRAAIAWLAGKLFRDYPLLHRIEANTRIDNHVMRRALESNRFTLEGQLRQTWRSQDGTRHDTALYGRLRSDA